jgi:hypothetical protein
MKRARDLHLGLAGFAEEREQERENPRESKRERGEGETERQRESLLGTILRNEVCAQNMLLNLL